jgi:hypothetical protein
MPVLPRVVFRRPRLTARAATLVLLAAMTPGSPSASVQRCTRNPGGGTHRATRAGAASGFRCHRHGAVRTRRALGRGLLHTPLRGRPPRAVEDHRGSLMLVFAAPSVDARPPTTPRSHPWWQRSSGRSIWPGPDRRRTLDTACSEACGRTRNPCGSPCQPSNRPLGHAIRGYIRG